MSKPATAESTVRNQYEALPYPYRNPEDELRALRATWLDRVDFLQSRFFDGALNLNTFRVLIAGDGTGDASMYLAEQLIGTDAEIVALDVSEASQNVSKARAEKRGLTNITYVNDSLLNLPNLGIGEFDYINCSGVLHHLESPSTGLSALRSALKPAGVMGIMVYGKIGRTGVYQAQEFLRLLTQDIDDIAAKVDLAKRYVTNLPDTNWLKLNAEHYTRSIDIRDDAGIYDLLLHSHDVAYTVNELYDWVEGCNLHLAELVEMQRGARFSYNPTLHTHDEALKRQLSKLNRKAQQQACELMTGNMGRHFLYVTKETPPAELDVEDETLIPHFLHGAPLSTETLKALQKSLENTALNKTIMLTSADDAPHSLITRREFTHLFLHQLTGQTSIGDIITQSAKLMQAEDNDIIRQRIKADLSHLIDEWVGAAILGLRKAEGIALPSTQELQTHMLKRIGAM